MPAESTVGVRLLLIGKDGMIAGYREVTAAQNEYSAAIERGRRASLASVGGFAAQEQGLARLGHSMTVYEGQLAAVNAQHDALARVGKVAFLGLGAAIAAWSYESVKWAKNYQTQLLLLHTQAGLTVNAMNAVGRAAMANAASLGATPEQYLQAAYHPASVGFRGAAITAITEAGLKEARISGADPETTVNSLVAVMRAYNMSARDATRTQALLNAAVGQGNMRYTEFNAALHSGIAATSALYGIKLPSMLSALAYLTDVGVPAAQAGTRLRMGISLLGAPSAESTKFLTTLLGTTGAQTAATGVTAQLQTMGLSTTALSAAMEKQGIYGAISLLARTFKAEDVPRDVQRAFIGRAFGGGRVGSAIMTLLNNPQLLNLKQGRIEAQATPAVFNKDFEKSMQTLSGATHQLTGELHTLGIEWGSKLLPIITDSVKWLTETLKWLDQNRAVVAVLGGAITTILVPAIGVYLYRAFLGAGSGIRSVLGAYANFFSGNTRLQQALKQTDASLAAERQAMYETAGATGKLTLADIDLARAQQMAGGPVSYDPRIGQYGGYRNAKGQIVSQATRGAADTPANLAGMGPIASRSYTAERDATSLAEKGGLLGLASKLGRIGGVGLDVVGKLLGWAGLGYTVGSMAKGNQGWTVNQNASVGNQARSLAGTMALGAGTGAAIGSVLPGPGTAVGAAVGTAAGAVYAERQPIWHGITSAWNDIFSSGPTRSPAQATRPYIVAHVYLDGKELTKSVVKQVKADTARQ